MKMAKRLYQRRRDVIFLIAGQDRSFYSGDENFTGGKPFGQWVLQQDDYDLSRFVFVGALPPPMLAEMFNLSDIHVYLTVPFVLSWSLWNALACGCTVLASDTAPVREIISHGQNGWLVDFFDIEGLASAANTILDKTGDYRRLGSAGVELVRRRYSLEVCLPQIRAMFESCGGRINS
jgi:glycosyltransferase involved in cell wall biosynthesis